MSTNLVVNGSFETPQISGGASAQGYTDYTAGQTIGSGWKVTAGSADVVSNAKGYFFSVTPAAGNQCLDLNGLTPGTITQNIPTVVGQRYLLRFAYTATPFTTDPSSPAVRKCQVQFGGSTVASLSKSVSGETPAKPGWQYVQYYITAKSSSSALTFSDTTPGSLGMGLDDISVTLSPPSPAAISGQVFADGNGDGKKGTDAIGLSGWTLWLDLNNTGTQTSSDPTVTTDHYGDFSLMGLPVGTYKLHITTQTGWKTTTSTIITVTLSAGKTVSGLLFGEDPV